MLPPDTQSNLLPWRVMVPLMQLSGSFPYKMSTLNDPPTFSLPFCLWAVFAQVLQLAMNTMSFSIMFLDHFKQDVGTATYISVTVVTMVTTCSSPIILAVKSPKLAALLHDLSVLKGVSPTPSYRWYCRPRTLALLSVFTVFIIFFSWIGFINMGFSNFVEVALLVLVTSLCALNFLFVEELPSTVFSLIAHRLVTATEATVAMVSSLLALDGSLQREGDVDAAVLALRDLEVVFQEVEEQRETGTNYFFPLVSMYLMMAVLLAIACPYAIMTGTLVGGCVFADLLIAYYIMARFCCTGQAFVTQISTAEKLLKKLRVQSPCVYFNVKVSQVMGSLSPMLTFDMCGWYRLDYAAFLGLINTVLTYLVIIFQVGGNTVYSAPSSCPQNTSLVPAYK